MSSISKYFKTEGRLPGLRLSGVLILVMLSLSGCLTRTAGPTLPYVKPAQSVPAVDPGPVHLAARVEDMEAEIQRLRDMIERAQTGGNDRVVKNLQERVAFIERQMGIESPKEPAPPTAQPNPPEFRQQPAPRPALPPVQTGRPDMPPPPQLDQRGQVGGVEIRNAPVPPDEKAYKEAYQSLRNGALDQAIAQFDDLLKNYPKSPLAANAVYSIGEAEFEKGRFGEAVLQFDRVVKEFPGSGKELSALLKQGQAFEKMGDTKSARIIYRKLAGDQPHSPQGRLAGTKLKQLPKDEQ